MHTTTAEKDNATCTWSTTQKTLENKETLTQSPENLGDEQLTLLPCQSSCSKILRRILLVFSTSPDLACIRFCTLSFKNSLYFVTYPLPSVQLYSKISALFKNAFSTAHCILYCPTPMVIEPWLIAGFTSMKWIEKLLCTCSRNAGIF